jgi:DNA-binding PadR family transcriptional regulator
MGRHRGKGGAFFGSFGRGFGYGHPFRTGRKVAAADLQLLVLALLAEKDSHGYELIKALEERSGGFYSPSPGVIYPALTYLEEIGHVTVEPEGARKRYRITEAGRQHLEQHRASVDAIFAELERIGQRMDDVRRAFSGEEYGPDIEDGGFSRRWSPELYAARRALKMALGQKRHCSREEAQRIAEILRRAATEILGR